MPYVLSFDGETVVYRADTPSRHLPQAGMLLFYGHVSDLFPYGVCARVTAVNSIPEGYAVGIETVEPSGIFSKAFYAGDSSDTEVEALARRLNVVASRAPVLTGEIGDGMLTASAELNMSVSDVVVNVPGGYYHATINVGTKVGLGIDVEFDDVEVFDETAGNRRFNFSPIALVLVPSVEMAAFMNIDAMLAFKYNLGRGMNVTYDWTRRNGEVTMTAPDVGDNGEDYNEASMELLLDGKVFCGLELTPRLGLIGNGAGAGIRMRLGPKFSAQLGVGTLQDLSKGYDAEQYAKGEMNMSLAMEYKAFLYYYDILRAEYVESAMALSGEREMFGRTLRLFPEYARRRATIEDAAVYTSAIVREPVECPLEVGFEVVDDGGTVIGGKFQDEVLGANNDEAIGIVEEFSSSDLQAGYNKDNATVHPVFKYRGYTVKAAPASEMANGAYPVFAYSDASGVSAVGGAFDSRSVSDDNTCFTIGNYLPVPASPSTVFSYRGGAGVEIGADRQKLFGTWTGKIGNEDVTLTLNEDSTGEWNGAPFNYTLDSPQAGDLKIKFTGLGHTKTLTVVSFDNEELVIKIKGKSATYKLTKQ